MSTDPLERVERVRPDDVDEALIWIIGERHHQRVREEMAAYLNDKMAMRALAAHSAAPSERDILTEFLNNEIVEHERQNKYAALPSVNYSCNLAFIDAYNLVLAFIEGKPTWARGAALSQDKPTVPK